MRESEKIRVKCRDTSSLRGEWRKTMECQVRGEEMGGKRLNWKLFSRSYRLLFVAVELWLVRNVLHLPSQQKNRDTERVAIVIISNWRESEKNIFYCFEMLFSGWQWRRVGELWFFLFYIHIGIWNPIYKLSILSTLEELKNYLIFLCDCCKNIYSNWMKGKTDFKVIWKLFQYFI